MNKKVRFLAIILTLIFSFSTATSVAAQRNEAELISANLNEFSDIKDVPEREYIDELKQNRIVNGVGGGLFLPDKTVTRAEALQIVANVSNKSVEDIKSESEINSKKYFNNIESKKWYSSAFVLSKLKGFNLRKNIFANKEISRQEFVYYIVNAVEQKYKMPMPDIIPFEIADEEDIEPKYRAAAHKVLIYQAFELDEDGKFNPDSKINRAEMAKITAKLLRYAKRNSQEIKYNTISERIEGRLIELNEDTDEKVYFQMVLENTTSDIIEMQFNSGKKYDYFVYNSNDELVYQWSEDKMFTQAVINEELLGNQMMVFEESWDLTDNDGNKVDDGIYTIVFSVKFVSDGVMQEVSDVIDYTVGDVQNKVEGLLDITNQTNDEIYFKMMLRNVSSDILNMEFRSGKKYDYFIYNSDDELVYQWSKDKMFTMDIMYKQLEENEMLEFEETWDYTDSDGNKVKDGAYKVVFKVEFISDDNVYEVSDVKEFTYKDSSKIVESDLVGTGSDQDKVSFEMIMRNISTDTLNLEFSSGKKYDYFVYNSNDELVYQWSEGRMFTMAVIYEDLKEDGAMIFKESWDYTDNDGNKVDEGEYRIEFIVEFVEDGNKYEISDEMTYTFVDIGSKVNADLTKVENGNDEEIAFEMIIENISDDILEMEFGSGKKYDYFVYNSDNELVYQWSEGRMFTLALIYEELNKDETMKFEETWNYKNTEGEKVKEGEYRLVFNVEFSMGEEFYKIYDEIDIEVK